MVLFGNRSSIAMLLYTEINALGTVSPLFTTIVLQELLYVESNKNNIHINSFFMLILHSDPENK